MYGKAGCCHSRCWLVGEESCCKLGLGSASQVALPASAGDIRDVGLIPRSGRSPGGGQGNPLPIFLPGESMERGAWRAIIHAVSKSQT